jgi:ABC-type transport system substrate-binding protein
MPTPENRHSGPNRGRYASAELDALIDTFMVTIPWRERMQVLGDLVFHLTDRLVVMGLYHSVSPTPVSNRLKNVPTGTPWNAHQWDAGA